MVLAVAASSGLAMLSSSSSALAASSSSQLLLQHVLLQVPRGGAAAVTASTAAGVLVTPLLLLGLPDYFDEKNKAAQQLANQQTSRNLSLSGLSHWWYTRWPSYVRYFISGNLGNVVLYLLERGLSASLEHYKLLAEDATPMYRASISFFVAYWLHIPVQHLLHAVLVYGLTSINTASKYWTTLLGMMSALALASVGSTVFNTLLLSRGVDKNVAFLMTLYSFSIVNYFVIGFIVQQSSKNADAAAASGGGRSNNNKTNNRNNKGAKGRAATQR